MTQLQLFKGEPLPPASCRRVWDRPQPGNEFSLAWEAGEIDFDALAKYLQEGQQRAARSGKKEAILGLRAQAEWLADQVARRNPQFNQTSFDNLLEALCRRLEESE